MKKYFFVSIFCFAILPRISFAQTEPRFYLYNYFLLHDEQGNINYKLDHAAVTKKIFEEMVVDPPGLDPAAKIEIPVKIINKEIYPTLGEKVFYLGRKNFSKALVAKIYLQYDGTMHRYVPAFDYKDVPEAEATIPSRQRSMADIPQDLFVFVPDTTPSEDLPKEAEIDPPLKKRIQEKIRESYKKGEWSLPVCQFISVMKKQYVVSRIESELGLAIDVYEIENNHLRKICGEWFDFFT
jgi:hypothetical protein